MIRNIPQSNLLPIYIIDYQTHDSATGNTQHLMNQLHCNRMSGDEKRVIPVNLGVVTFSGSTGVPQ